MKVNEKVKNPGCPYCSGHRVLKGFNDLATLVPDLIRDWDYEKNNPLTPNEVTKGSNKKVWWKCHSCKYEWRMVIYDRGTLGKGCPKCKKANLINPNSKCVIQLTLDGNVIAEYKSVKEAVKQTGIKTIDKVCRKERKTAGGYIWKYKD